MSKGYRKCEICHIQEAHAGKGLFFSRFPTELNRCRAWLKATGNQELVWVPIEKLHAQRNVCANHFSKKDFNRKGNRLKRCAIPTLNLTAPPLTESQLAEFPQHVASYYKKDQEKKKDNALESTTSEPTISKTEPTADTNKRSATKKSKAKVKKASPSTEAMDIDEGTFAGDEPAFDDNDDTKNLTTDNTAPPKKTNTYTIYWKQKLKQILHSAQFCGICLSTDTAVSSVSDQLDIVAGGKTHTRTLADILHVVFRETKDLVASSQICKVCAKKLIRSYMFIQQARETSLMLRCHINDLYTKTCYVLNGILKDPGQVTGEIKNVVIGVEKYENVPPLSYFWNKMKKVRKKSRTDGLVQKRKIKCVSCKLLLYSHEAWEEHKMTAHKNKNFITKPKVIKVNEPRRKICKICSRVIHCGRKGYLEHIKKYHEHCQCVCSTCRLVFKSYKDLAAHMQEKHYKKDMKCSGCKESPCVHHKYLRHYRQQILNGANRTKCLDCEYICSTKRALIKHVEEWHLKRDNPEINSAINSIL